MQKKDTDQYLMASIAAGNLAALTELVRRYQEKVLALSYRYLGSWDLAEDVAQETFLRVCQSADRYQPSAKFVTWLYRIVVNLCIDQIRRRRRHEKLLGGFLADTSVQRPPESLMSGELRERVQQAVGSLPERQRQAVILHRYEELSHAEISQVTGWSKSAAESLLVRAYKNLRRLLAELE